MTVNELRDFENYYKCIAFVKERSYYSMKRLKRKNLLLVETKLIKQIPDLHDTKEHYQSFIRKKNRKSIKQSKITTYQPKTFENPNVVDMKSVITKHPKPSHKLSKTIIQAEKVSQVGSNSSFYSDTKNNEKFLNEKNIKITKRAHAFRGVASSYNVKILKSFNPELQPKDTESAIKNKLKKKY